MCAKPNSYRYKTLSIDDKAYGVGFEPSIYMPAKRFWPNTSKLTTGQQNIIFSIDAFSNSLQKSQFLQINC